MIDETGFSLIVRPLYGWDKRDRRLVLKIIVAGTKNKFLGLKMSTGSISANAYGCFFICLLVVNPSLRECLNDYVFVM